MGLRIAEQEEIKERPRDRSDHPKHSQKAPHKGHGNHIVEEIPEDRVDEEFEKPKTNHQQGNKAHCNCSRCQFRERSGKQMVDPASELPRESQQNEKKRDERGCQKKEGNSTPPPASIPVADRADDGIQHKVHRARNGGDDQSQDVIRRAFGLQEQRQHVRPDGFHQIETEVAPQQPGEKGEKPCPRVDERAAPESVFRL